MKTWRSNLKRWALPGALLIFLLAGFWFGSGNSESDLRLLGNPQLKPPGGLDAIQIKPVEVQNGWYRIGGRATHSIHGSYSVISDDAPAYYGYCPTSDFYYDPSSATWMKLSNRMETFPLPFSPLMRELTHTFGPSARFYQNCTTDTVLFEDAVCTFTLTSAAQWAETTQTVERILQSNGLRFTKQDDFGSTDYETSNTLGRYVISFTRIYTPINPFFMSEEVLFISRSLGIHNLKREHELAVHGPDYALFSRVYRWYWSIKYRFGR